MEPDFITQLVLQYKYAIMAPAALLLGPIVSLVSGVLLRLGTVALLPTCIALASGELFGDVLWYWLGSRYGDSFARRFGRYVGITSDSVSSVKRIFHRYHDTIIFISKLTGGFGFAPGVFFTAGLSRVPFRRYVAFVVLGQIVWTTGLLAIGYFLGHLYADVGNVFEKVGAAALVVAILLLIFGFGRYLRSVIEKHP